MKRLIFATGNQNKMREIREILADLPVEILVHEGGRDRSGYCGRRKNL